MTKDRLQDTQRMPGARTDPSLTRLVLRWRNKLEDFVRVIFKLWSEKTELISEFGATACKALYKCKDCLEPFEHFKCI